MDIHSNWGKIRGVFEQGFKSCFHFAVATTGQDGTAHISPIGSLILRDDCTGYYCEEFSSQLPQDLQYDHRVCVMAVNADKIFWGRALLEGRFSSAPGVRLYGLAGERREGTGEEIGEWQKRVGYARPLKGYKILWEKMHTVRDIKFDSFDPVSMGEMTDGLW